MCVDTLVDLGPKLGGGDRVGTKGAGVGVGEGELVFFLCYLGVQCFIIIILGDFVFSFVFCNY